MIKHLVLRVRSNHCRRMPLFNNAAIAASFRTTTNLNPNENNNTGNNKKNRNGIETHKSELVKQEVPIGMTVLRLVLPMKKYGYYMDLDNVTAEQVLESILNILENQEEGIALEGKQEWMETWLQKQDNPQVFLSNIQEIEQEMLTNYFQQGTEKVGEMLR
jgi:hypothetical protein